MLIELLAISFMCTVCGFVWIEYLSQPGEVFGAIGEWLRKKLKHVEIVKVPVPETDLYMEKEIEHESYFYKPIIGCAKCNAGQLAFWSYLVAYWQQYHIGHHVFTACAAVLMAVILNRLMEKR